MFEGVKRAPLKKDSADTTGTDTFHIDTCYFERRIPSIIVVPVYTMFLTTRLNETAYQYPYNCATRSLPSPYLAPTWPLSSPYLGSTYEGVTGRLRVFFFFMLGLSKSKPLKMAPWQDKGAAVAGVVTRWLM